MLLLGIDIGTSSIKATVMDAATRRCIASTQYPETEAAVISLQPGWAEQDPDSWWENTQLAILKLHALHLYEPSEITAIGIAYQMHGLVLVDREQNVLRNSIIWCDSRAVETGNQAFDQIGREKCLLHLLNSPGNFTASKLAWVKQNEPAVYEKIDKVMLPGDFISMKLTGEINTSIAALSEGIFWDFQRNELSEDVFAFYGLNKAHIPGIQDVFSVHGLVSTGAAELLSLKKGIPVTYKAGDQPNNALSLNVNEPGEVAATAGTSGVIYGISDQLTYDSRSRINSFAHVNYTVDKKRLGILLCINGTGIMNRWVRSVMGNHLSYAQINEEAGKINKGSDGLLIFPFGNGAERIFENKIPGAHLQGIDLNKHGAAHIYRAAQEGIAFAFRYGLDIMKENGMNPAVIRAGRSNMFLSGVFTAAFAGVLNIPVELYNCDGSVGAAVGAGLGAKFYSNTNEAFDHFKPEETMQPADQGLYEEIYQRWLLQLKKHLD